MVHCFECLGVYVAADVNSGAVHVLDREAWEVLRVVEPPMTADCPQYIREKFAHQPDLEEIWAELFALYEEGLLFADDEYVKALPQVKAGGVIKALCLHVSHDCNLRCSYCFASTGDFGTGRKTMTPETAKKAIDFVIEKSGPRRNIEVDFFGGEPLMAMETVRQTVEYARSIEKQHGKCFRFTITTNGMLLNDEISKYINEEMSNVVLSLDGRREVNDLMRKTPIGTGSYDLIVPKYQKLVEGRGVKDYYVRGTFTKHNLDFAEDVIHMHQQGFKNVSVEPVVASPEAPYGIDEADLPRVCAEYEKLAEYVLKTDINFFHFNVDLEQGPCVIKRLRGCGAGCEYVAVTPEGDVYPCHQFVGKPEYKMGNVNEGELNREVAQCFAEVNVFSREECSKCWAKYYCSGGCSASNLTANGNIATPHNVACELERKRLECAIAIKALEA